MAKIIQLQREMSKSAQDTALDKS